MKGNRGQKFSVAVLIIVVVSIILYIIQGIYFDSAGKIETEYALKSSEKEILSVDGFAVRDEGRIADGKNTAILYKNTNKVYVPVVSDSENVAKDDVIAVAFKDELQANAYLEAQQLREKKMDLEHMQSQKDLSRINVIYLNSKVYSTAHNYVAKLLSKDFSGLALVTDDLSDVITSKQLATGKELDFSSSIKSYDAQITSLEKGYSNAHYVKSPFAGYFVSDVDGYENIISYDDVASKKAEKTNTAKLLSAKQKTYENSFGKIIGQHTWYLMFDVSIDDATIIKTGKKVIVDFPERSVHDIPMTVHYVSPMKDNMITVTLKCKYLNEQLAVLRKEKMSITIEEYEGFRINSKALFQNEEGIEGVYVLSGNVAKFTPLNILLYGDGFVIAEKYTAFKTDKDGNSIVDEEKTALYREIKAYDRVIVKGNNITDGKIIN